MADSRSFVLIGEFKDGITPELAKINKEIAKLKANFAGVGSKKDTGFRGATKEIGKLVSAHKNLADSVKNVQKELRSSISVLAQYRKEMGKAASATRAFQKAGGTLGSKSFAKNMSDANAAAQQYLRTLQKINSTAARTPSRLNMPAAGGGSARTRARSGGGGGGYAAAAGGAAAGGVIGMQLGNVVESAIVSGFRIGTDIMMTPFKYFANRITERIEDEQSDIKAAGGMFSIAKRQSDPFVRTMDEAMEFTQMNNKYLAELAAVLPGNTQQYIEVSKRISDSISKIVSNDKEAAIAFANELRQERGEGAISGGAGRKQTQEAITELLGQMTKKTVLAGLGGGGGGPGGLAGAYGLPQLTERMLTQDEVSMGQFQRYAAIFRDPLIMDALSRFIPKVNATTAGTLERFQVLDKLFDEVLPPEMIRKFERSTAGIIEAFNTAFLGPETGFLGLGRKMEGLGKRMNDYGQYVKVLEDGTFKVVQSIEEASDVDLSIFDMLRDVFANFSIALYPIVQFLPQLFDPLKKIGLTLTDIRHESGRFLSAFESYKKGLKGLADDMLKKGDKMGAQALMKDLDLRATLAAINNSFRKFGVFDTATFTKNAEKIMSREFDAGSMLREFINTFMNSGMAKELGRTIGTVIGTVLSELANFGKQLTGMAEASGLVSGLKEGFNSAGGMQAIKDIIGMVFAGISKLIITFVTAAPFESAMIAGLFLLPSVIAGVVSAAVTKVFSGGLPLLKTAFQKLADSIFRIKPVTTTVVGSTTPITDPRRMLPAAKGAQPAALPASALAKPVAQGTGWFGGMINNLKMFGQVITKPMQLFGKLNVGLAAFTGIVEFITALFTGKDLAEALGAAAGPVLGSLIGGAILGPLGAMIGTWIGSQKPVVDTLTGIFKGVAWGLSEAWKTVGPLFDSIGGVLKVVWDGFWGLIPGMDHLANNFDFLNLAFIAVKIAFFPFVSALNGAVAGIQLLQIGLLKFDQWVNSTFQFGDRAGRIQAALDAAGAGLQTTAARQANLNASLLQGLPARAPAKPSTTMSPIFATGKANGGLGDAISSELKNKPPGSDLVIANSSETVIPAAGGLGMQAFIDTLAAGFAAVEDSFKIVGKGVEQSDKNSKERSDATNSKITEYHNKTQSQILQINQQLATLSSMGGGGMPLGAGYGSGGGAIAGALGDFIKKSGGAPGSIHEHPAHGGVKGKHAPGSYHYSGRAIDIGAYANEQAGVIARIKQFNAQMGVKPVEFLHAGNDPNHQDHVHVAYALGKGRPAFFGSQGAAERWEASMAGSMNVRSITGNTMEGFGSGGTINNNITINQQPGQNAEELATIVALKIGEAVADARASSIFV